MTKKQKKTLIGIIIAALLTVILNFIDTEGILRFILFLIPYLIIGYDILKKAFFGIISGQVFDENFLMALATVGAIIIALLQSGDYNEAVAVMLFYQIGELFQSVAVGKSRRNISQLMDIRPDYANIEENGQLIQVDPEKVQKGSIIIVQPGEKIPIDGIIVEGNSSVDTAALTGESVPHSAGVGDEVISGCINMSGVLKIRTIKEFGESTVSKILDLVENASSRKSKSENFISKFAKYYTPAVCAGALLLAVVPPVINIILGAGANWESWIYRALTFLVISCPCALVISIPLTFFAGIGGASKEGILIKGSNYLETLSKVKYVVFDKTGTLTKGVFEVNAIHHTPLDNAVLLDLAAHAEIASSHPISKSIKSAYGKEPNRSRVTDIKEISGKGVIATVDGKEVAAGNDKLMEYIGTEYIPCHKQCTIIHIAVNGEYQGHIVISDVLKENSPKAIKMLKKSGVEKTVMLTGDIESAAEDIAKKVGVDKYYSGLLPDDKVAKVEELIAEKPKGEMLAFVGDGINDAPVLSRADVGIAMGAMGSDAAIEAADVVLMDDDPMKISKAIRISKKCLTIVYENIVFAIAVKFICLILGAFGIANMWTAIFADVGVMVIAVINAIRALIVKKS